MEKLRKSLKAYVIALVLFVALTFALAALVNFLAIILVSVQGLFAEEFSLGKTGWLYLIPVAAGSLGGICGVNHKT